MKFLCPSCKAKYQIADEKVAGRSVRMKCRKCGHVIQVSSIAGVGDALLGSEPPSAIDAPSDASAAQASMPEPPPSSQAKPAAAELSKPPGSERKPGLASKPGTVSQPTAASKPQTQPTAASKPSAEFKPGAASKPEPKLDLKKGPAVPTRPSVSKPTPAPSAAAKGPLPAPKAPPAKSAPARPFAASPAATSPAASSPLPVSPVATPSPFGSKSDKKTIQGGISAPLPRVAPVPAKATSPGVAKADVAIANALADFDADDESTRIADSSALAGAFSLAVGGPSEAAPADALTMPADEWFVGINGVPVGPIRLSELRSKAASGSVTRESLVWRDGFEDWRPLKTFPELVAIVDESVSSARASLTPFTPSVAIAEPVAAVGAVVDPFAAPAPGTSPRTPDPFAIGAVAGVTGTAVVTDDLEAAGLRKRGGSSPAAWIAVAIALLFGLTIGFVLFKQQSKTIEVVKYVDRVVPGAPSAVAGDNAQPIGESTISADPKNPTKRVAGTARPGASAEGDKGLSGLKGLTGLTGLGPSHGPDSSGPTGSTSGSGQLDSGQIQSTVARYTGSVKRACWQPALDTRDKDAPTTARVSVAITVLPSGSVQNATVGGDPRGYRGLAQCISSRVRGWQFPPSGDTTTVNVPFVFAAQ